MLRDDRPVVLVVDDTPDNLSLMAGLLRDRYRVRLANSGERALQLAKAEPPPDVVLLDVMMPGLDGHEVCRRLKADPATADMAVIFLTALDEVEDEARGLALGAADFIAKPIRPPILLARLETQLTVKRATAMLRDHNTHLEQEVRRRTAEIEGLQDATVLTMASLAETRDNDTGNHLRRTQHYVECLARELRKQPRYAATLNDQTISLLFKSAPLHDIGKIGIPDAILLKPGKLTAEEFEVMKTHTTIGFEAIERAEASIGHALPFLRYAKEIALSHQEKWDGSGYPQGLAGEAIPLSARLMALADVYDALICKRVYKPAMASEQAEAIILAGRGTHFDPAVVDAFERVRDNFRAIAQRFAD
ncbi:MAG: two-component system response regulator [Burkholderiales bacterium]|nr:two-component system response regulator [Burkholderiales bacterium]